MLWPLWWTSADHDAPLVAPFSLSLAKSQPEKSEATSDNEGDPARPHRYRPVSDGDGPLHKNPHQVEQRHHGEDHPSHKRKRFCVHESSSQGAAAAYPESNISGHPARTRHHRAVPQVAGWRGPNASFEHDSVCPGLLSTMRDGPVVAFSESYIESGYEQHCLGSPNSGRSCARRAHASRSCPRSGMSPSVGSILGEQGQQPADQCRLHTRRHRTGV